jgi:hypothetical protein
MKKIFLILFLAFFIGTINTNAQLFKESKVSECYAKAKTFANENGYTNPELFAIGAMSGSYTLSGIPVTLKIDIAKGTSTVWVFAIRSAAKKDSTLYCGVVKTINPLDPLMALRVPLNQLPNLNVDITSTLTPYNWMDSDKIYGFLSKNQSFINYMAANAKDTVTTMILGLVVMDIPVTGAYWGSNFSSKKANLNCLTNAVSGETTCLVIPTSVNEDLGIGVSVYPNPATEYLNITLPVEYQSADSKLTLSDYSGNEVRVLQAPKFGESSNIILNLNEFSNGSYFLRYTSSKGNFVKSFNVVR